MDQDVNNKTDTNRALLKIPADSIGLESLNLFPELLKGWEFQAMVCGITKNSRQDGVFIRESLASCNHKQPPKLPIPPPPFHFVGSLHPWLLKMHYLQVVWKE